MNGDSCRWAVENGMRREGRREAGPVGLCRNLQRRECGVWSSIVVEYLVGESSTVA